MPKAGAAIVPEHDHFDEQCGRERIVFTFPLLAVPQYEYVVL